jgi:hypothetical protein
MRRAKCRQVLECGSPLPLFHRPLAGSWADWPLRQAISKAPGGWRTPKPGGRSGCSWIASCGDKLSPPPWVAVSPRYAVSPSSTRQAGRSPTRPRLLGYGQRIRNPRYGRLEICATTVRFMGRSHDNPTRPPRQGAANDSPSPAGEGRGEGERAYHSLLRREGKKRDRPFVSTASWAAARLGL